MRRQSRPLTGQQTTVPAVSSSTVGVRFWLVTAAAGLTVGITASLGFWQLGRAEQKQALQTGIASQAAMPPLSGSELLAAAEWAPVMHRPVVLRGHWLPGTLLFLDNRPMNGRTGFIVLSALRLEGSARAVLVQRGWVPRDFQDRERLPTVPTVDGPVGVTGRLAPPPSQLFELGHGAAGPIRQNVDLSQLAQEWRVPLLEGLSVLQTGDDASGLVREWPRFVDGRHKHLGYAVQWFAMSAIAAGLYLWFQIFLPRLKRRSHGQNPR